MFGKLVLWAIVPLCFVPSAFCLDQKSTSRMSPTLNSVESWDRELCLFAQMQLVKGLEARDIQLTVHDESSFSSTKTSIEGGKLLIHARLYDSSNQADHTVDCKLIAADRVADQLKRPVEAQGNCSALNQSTLDAVLMEVSSEVRDRYLASGRKLVFADDVLTGTGGEWLRTEASYYQKVLGKTVEMRSVALKEPWNAKTEDPTTGVSYCKLFSAATMKRWVSELSLQSSPMPLPVSEIACVPRFDKVQGSCRFTPPFLEEVVCQDYTGLAWTAEEIANDCSNKEGIFQVESCKKQEASYPNEAFGRCVIQCSKPYEKVWHLFSNPDKWGIDINNVCDRFAVTPNKVSNEFPIHSMQLKIAGDVADVYYPERSGASPLLLFLQGGRVDKQFYQEYAKQVAAGGFIVVVPNHFSSLFDEPELFAELSEIENVQSAVAQLNNQIGSVLYGRWHMDQFGLLGHSFGAAAAVDAIQNTCRFPFCGADSYQRPSNLKAVALTGINTKPFYEDEIYPTLNQGLPIAFINGKNDSNADYETTLTSYHLIQDPPKMFVAIKGGNHYSLADVNNPAGPKPDEAEMLIPQDTAIRLSSTWTILFLRAHILNDAEALKTIYANPNYEDGFVILKSQASAVK